MKKRRPPLPRKVHLDARTEHDNVINWEASVSRVTQRFVYLLARGREKRYSLSKGVAASVDDRVPLDWRIYTLDLRRLRRAAGWPLQRL